MRLHYRRVNQAERYQVAETRLEGGQHVFQGVGHIRDNLDAYLSLLSVFDASEREELYTEAMNAAIAEKATSRDSRVGNGSRSNGVQPVSAVRADPTSARRSTRPSWAEPNRAAGVSSPLSCLARGR